MGNQYMPLFNEAIRVERNIASFYTLCAKHFKEDRVFWQTLSEEEEHHADILESGLELLLEENLFPDEILDLDIKELKATNDKLEERISQFQEKYLTGRRYTPMPLNWNRPLLNSFSTDYFRKIRRESIKNL